ARISRRDNRIARRGADRVDRADAARAVASRGLAEYPTAGCGATPGLLFPWGGHRRLVLLVRRSDRAAGPRRSDAGRAVSSPADPARRTGHSGPDALAGPISF